MKIWVQNLGWQGMIVVVAESEIIARDIMKKSANNYDADVELESFEIKNNTLIDVCMGDT